MCVFFIFGFFSSSFFFGFDNFLLSIVCKCPPDIYTIYSPSAHCMLVVFFCFVLFLRVHIPSFYRFFFLTFHCCCLLLFCSISRRSNTSNGNKQKNWTKTALHNINVINKSVLVFFLLLLLLLRLLRLLLLDLADIKTDKRKRGHVRRAQVRKVAAAERKPKESDTYTRRMELVMMTVPLLCAPWRCNRFFCVLR